MDNLDLAKLRALHAEATPGELFLLTDNKGKPRKRALCGSSEQVYEVSAPKQCFWVGLFVSEADAIAYTAAHNAFPALLDRLEAAEREIAQLNEQLEEDSAAINDIYAVKLSELRVNLAAAERERERTEKVAEIAEAGHWIDIIRRLDPEHLCDVFDGLGVEETLQAWLSARDTRMNMLGEQTGIGYAIDALSMAESSEEAMEMLMNKAARLRREAGE